jgi:uncharacterized protein (TIGR02611 family)
MSAQNFVHKITAKRQNHLKRPVIIRALYVVFGFILLLPGIPLLALFPEAGIPLVLIGLGFLSLEYTWAGKILLWFARVIDKIIAWYRSLSRPIRYTIELLFLLLAIYITWLIFW